ncbi:hypothetical protein [Moraxella sp.]|nr:hypothetical protein [Moraxella sp.]MDO4895582.1 hypothetical protein [Moraxella sp.]
MKITLELKPENYQIFQALDDSETEQPIIYRKAGSAEGLIRMSDDFD